MTARPDISILLDRFGPGGVERVACHLANGLARRGMRTEIVVLSDEGPVRSLIDPAVTVRRLGALPAVGRGARLIAAVPAIAGYLGAYRPGLFHSPGNHTHVAAALAMRQARFSGGFVPKITNPILKDGVSGWGRGLRRRFYGRAFAEAARILVLSRAAVKDIGAIDEALSGRAAFVHNPYVSETMLARAGQRAPASPPVILSVGRLSHQKDQATLLRAAALLGDRPWKLRICGTGPKEASLRSLAAELGIADRLDLPGFVGDVVPDYLSASVMALSSRWEDLPATLIEAMACGCPVLSTASSPAVVGLLDSLGREALPIGDAQALSGALAAALDGTLPAIPSKAVAAYGIEASCDEHAAIFADVLSRPSARGF